MVIPSVLLLQKKKRKLPKKPEIPTFDEATSALDAKSEEMIKRALKEICKHKTVIIISHRMSLIEGMQRIFSIQDKQVVEITRASITAANTHENAP